MKTQHSFASIEKAEIPRSKFDLSHPYSTTFDGGLLIPILVAEVVPGDTFNCTLNAFARFSTPLVPFMTPVHLDTFFFFVPHRLTWVNFVKMMGEQTDPGDSVDFTIPMMDMANQPIPVLEMFDYMGVPTVATDLVFSALPGRAYNLIWNEWFRDENLQDSIVVNTDNGPDFIADYELKRRGERKNYFTGALPFLQKGDATPVVFGGTGTVTPGPGTGPTFDVNAVTVSLEGFSGGPNTNWSATTTTGAKADWNSPDLLVDASTFTGNTINQLRQAFQIQRLLERDARGGTRYNELIYSHFGVVSDDARLNRPEFLGGGSQPLNISSVPQTSETGTSPQGHLAAFGTSAGSGHRFMKSFTEHGYIIGLMCARADLQYQEGLHRMWTRSAKLDHLWPALTHIGDQAILNGEIKAVGSLIPGSDDLVFGYTGRYDEYRTMPGKVTGLMRSNHPQTTHIWHLANFYDGAVPVLGSDFIEHNPPFDRVVAVTSEPHFKLDAWFDMSVARAMPTQGTPGMVDHF